jgi:hypothetical protein
VQQTATSNKTNTQNTQRINKVSIYEGDFIHHFKATDLSCVWIAITFCFKFHFLLRETHKAACEIRDCKKKKKSCNLRGEKKMK